jgi:hypothetical protein
MQGFDCDQPPNVLRIDAARMSRPARVGAAESRRMSQRLTKPSARR